MHQPTAAQTIFDRLKTQKIYCSPHMLLMLVVMYIFVAFNDTFWTKGLEVFGGHIAQLILFYAAIFLLTMAFFALFALPYVLRPFLAFVLILGAVTSYYMDNLGVIIDRDMIQNVVTTTLTESKHLLTAAFILHVAVFGALPALVVLLFFRVKPQRRWMAIISPVATCAVCLALAVGLLMSNFKTYSSILRERKDLMSSYQPGAPIVAAIRYAKMMTRSVNVVVAPIGEDARKGSVYQTNSKPTLTIIVAGETARSQNFSLNGYGIDTNPELSKKDVVSFTNVTSCGTATATSLPCMFSKYTRDDYSYDKGISTESLLDVLAHAGFHVEWWDNNTGDKGVAARLPVQFFTNSDNPEHCSAGECDDGILLEHLRSYLPTITQDTVLVLHQIGSHGPAYYLRHPEAFEKFKPACRTAEFKDCTAAEITNAYDNSIAYTDFILSQTIDLLAGQDNLATSLLYVSDHGESLGEGGLYLHGSPYFMAPEFQTMVPMIFWMSDAYKQQMALSGSCVKGKSDKAFSHDNLFHSVLGMMHVQTNVYQAALDLFSGCAEQTLVVKSDG